MNSIGDNLRNIREKRGYTQNKFAELLHTNQANVSAWERNYRRPTDAMIQHIADVFNVPVYSILSFDSENNYDDLVKEIAEAFRREPNIRLLFEKTRYMSSEDIEVVLTVACAISKERKSNE